MLGALHALPTLMGSAGTLLLPNIMDRGLTIAQYIHQRHKIPQQPSFFLSETKTNDKFKWVCDSLEGNVSQRSFGRSKLPWCLVYCMDTRALHVSACDLSPAHKILHPTQLLDFCFQN
jgi:hypothetical protein